MLFDNAKLEPGETILVQAGGSGIGTVAIKMAKAIGCTVITTVGDDEKAVKAKALGADHVINYRTDRFEGVVRKLTAKKGVDVAFEHVGPDTFNGSLLCLKRGGRLVTCGSTFGPIDDAEPVPALSSAIPHYSARSAHRYGISARASPNGIWSCAGDRHRGPACGFRTRPCAARKPAGFRQIIVMLLDIFWWNHEPPANPLSVFFDRALWRSMMFWENGVCPCASCSDGSAAAQASLELPPGQWPRAAGRDQARGSAPHGQICRGAGAQNRTVAARAPGRPRQPACRIPGKIRRRDRTNSRRRMGQSRPGLGRVRPPRRIFRRRVCQFPRRRTIITYAPEMSRVVT